MPTEVVKSRMQTGQFTSARGAVWQIASREGIAGGLFAGFGSFLLRDLPFDAIEFASYEQMKITWSSVSGDSENEIGKHESAAIGAAAGMLTGAVTTPLDVVKTRLMTQGGMKGKTRYYKGVMDCVTRTVAEEGWIVCSRAYQPESDVYWAWGWCVLLRVGRREEGARGRQTFNSFQHDFQKRRK